jgi:hypothetical protein
MKTKLIVVVFIITLLIAMLPPVSAVRVYTDMTVRGVGYLDMETRFNTHDDYKDGHEAVVSSRGSGEIISETEVIEMDSNNQRLNISASTIKSYAPISYLNMNYDRMLSGRTSAKNYMVGVAIVERHYDTLSISSSMLHYGDRNRTNTELHTEIVGKAQFGVVVRNTEDYHHTIMRVREDFVGDFTMDKVIIVENAPEP